MNPPKIIDPGELFSSTWSFFMKNWEILVSIPVALFLSFGVAALLFAGAIYLNSIVLVIICGILYLALVIVGSTIYVNLINTVHRLSTESNPNITIFCQYKFGLSLFWSTLLLSIILILVTYGSLALFIIPGIIITVYVSMSLFILTIDNKKGFTALNESYTLVRGRWWSVFGRILLLGVTLMGIGLIYEIAVVIVSVILGMILPHLVVGIITAILIFAFEAVLLSFVAVYMYKIFISLKQTYVPTSEIKSIKPWLVAASVLGIFVIIGYIVLIVSFTKFN